MLERYRLKDAHRQTDKERPTDMDTYTSYLFVLHVREILKKQEM